MDLKVAVKAFILFQLEKVLFPLGRDEIARLYYLLSRYLDRKRINQRHTQLA